MLKASYSAREPQMAFNGAADRIEKQLRRYTNRLKDHKVDEDAAAVCRECRLHDLRRRPRRSEAVGFPTIVAETRVDIPEASVSDAVMLMDLRNTNALLFKNSGDGRVQHDLPPRRREYRLG